MKYTKWIWTVVVVIMVVTFVNLRPLHAGENYRKKIILFSEKTKWAEIRAYAVKWEKRGVVISMEVPIINGLVAGVPEGVTDAELAADRRVSSIETNLELSGNDAVKGQGASFIKPLKRPPMVDDAANRYEAPWSVLKLFDQPYDNRYFSGWLTLNDIPDAVIDALGKLNETKTSIAVFDTGIDDIHHYTRDIVQKGVNVDEFSENDGRLKLQEEDSYDDNGHGSHIAGILGAILDREHSWGQEADIDLNSIKVLGDDGMGYLSNIIYGLQWAIDHDIRIANMSIGYRQDSPAVRRAVKEASKAGIIMLASVGNKSNYDPNVTLKTTADGASADGASADGASADGASADGASADGASADGASADGASGNGLPEFSVMYPARYPEVIAVGASNAYGKLATFSNSGEEMDIMAPGASILSVDITNGDHYTGLGTTSGTSMSVPYVTAAVAMMLALDPALSADEIKDILTETAHIEDVDSSAGDLNLVAALDEVKYRMEENRFRNNRNRDVEKSYRKKLKERIHSARMASARRPVKN